MNLVPKTYYVRTLSRCLGCKMYSSQLTVSEVHCEIYHHHPLLQLGRIFLTLPLKTSCALCMYLSYIFSLFHCCYGAIIDTIRWSMTF